MKWIISNLKMNLTLPEIIEYERKLSQIEFKNPFIVCPSLPFLAYFRSSNYHLGSQTVSYQEEGSFTGEVSAKQLKSLNVEYTIIGHSERRQKLLENNIQIGKKIALLFQNDICPILCIGEEEKDMDIQTAIGSNLDEIFQNIKEINNIIIAYEPSWAIGTGSIPDNDTIEKTVHYIKTWFYNHYHYSVNVVYGGSVSTTNILTLNKISNLDGYLLGGMSLDIESLKEIVKSVEVES